MSKKKNKQKTNTINDNKRMELMMALEYIFQKEEEKNKREIAKTKTKNVLSVATFVGAIIIAVFTFVTTYSFDFSWTSDIKKWYSDIYISFAAYLIITDIVLMLEKHFKVDQKPVFGYLWPFVGFAITLFLTNSIHAEIIKGEPRTIMTILLIVLVPTVLMMINTYEIGANKAKEELKIIEYFKKLIEDNPDDVETIINDYEKWLNKNKK